jgi:hypothetical protein
MNICMFVPLSGSGIIVLFLCLQIYVGNSVSCWMPSMFEEFSKPLL